MTLTLNMERMILPRLNRVLQIESLVILAAFLAAYAIRGDSWLLFLLVIIVPDSGMAGYLVNPMVGARVYNAVHTYIGPAVLFGLAYGLDWQLGETLALIWGTHIAIDRTMGYGLKYPTQFKDTHLQRV